MTTHSSPPDAVEVVVARWAALVVGVLWLAVAGLVAIVVRLGVPTPAELLRDVADRPVSWIGANALLIVQQAFLVLALPALALVPNAAAPGVRSVSVGAARGLLWLAAGALVASGVFHGVFGAHLGSKVTSAPIDEDLRLAAEVVHALGDTSWFVGVAAMAAATAAASVVWCRDPSAGTRWLGVVGLTSVLANSAQFGWFVDHAFGVFAAPGTALQAAWFVGVALLARPASPTAR